MDHFEMVEKLRERTGVSYEDAKAALEATEWDLLDAIVALETEGKIAQGASDYSTRQEERREEQSRRRGEFKSTMNRIVEQLGRIIDKGNRTLLDVHKNDSVVFSVPLTVLAILLVFAAWVVLPLMAVGLFTGYTYKISGMGASAKVVNSAMDKASGFANTIKTEMTNNKKGDD